MKKLTIAATTMATNLVFAAILVSAQTASSQSVPNFEPRNDILMWRTQPDEPQVPEDLQPPDSFSVQDGYSAIDLSRTPQSNAPSAITAKGWEEFFFCKDDGGLFPHDAPAPNGDICKCDFLWPRCQWTKISN